MASLPTRLSKSAIKKRGMINNKLLRWSKNNFRSYPWRDEGTPPYNILLAELLLKRTTATAAAKHYPELIKELPSICAIEDMSLRSLSKSFSGLGLHNQRARSIKSIAHHIKTKNNEVIPQTLDELLHIPGLGDYSARAILSFGFNLRAAIVDSNVKRVYSRIFYKDIDKKSTDKIYQNIADLVLPARKHRLFNFALLDFSALTCKYDKPDCKHCVINSICDYHLAASSLNFNDRDINYLHKVRIKKGITLVGLSKLSGISKNTIVNIEGGRCSPRLSTIYKLSTALGIRPETMHRGLSTNKK